MEKNQKHIEIEENIEVEFKKFVLEVADKTKNRVEKKEVIAFIQSKGLSLEEASIFYNKILKEYPPTSFWEIVIAILMWIFSLAVGAILYLIVWKIVVTILSLMGPPGMFITGLLERLPILALIAIPLAKEEGGRILFLGILVGVLITYFL